MQLRSCLLALCLAAASLSQAALPPQPPGLMLQRASHAIVGKVVRIYERRDTSTQGQVVVSAVAEIEVLAVEKGQDVRPGERLFARYWWRQWLPGSTPMPGNDGNAPLPAEGEAMKIYLSGSRAEGFEVLLPGGFAK